MRRTIIALFAFFLMSPALAQQVFYLSSTGNDSAACGRTDPCASFSRAYSFADAGSVIVLLDSNNYTAGNGSFGSGGTVNIGKSLTLRAEGVNGLFNGNGGNYLININIAATDNVTLEGLVLNGGGIQVVNGGTVNIRNCVIRNNNSSASSFYNVYGVKVIPTTGAIKMVISDTVVENNGNSNGGAGIYIAPGLQSGSSTSTGTAQITLLRVLAAGNRFGVAADTSFGNGSVNLTVIDSVFSDSGSDGLIVVGNSVPIAATVLNSKFTNNPFGIRSLGSGAVVRVENSKVAGNGTGVSGGGALLSGGGNTVQANGTNGGFTGSYAQQ